MYLSIAVSRVPRRAGFNWNEWRSHLGKGEPKSKDLFIHVWLLYGSFVSYNIILLCFWAWSFWSSAFFLFYLKFWLWFHFLPHQANTNTGCEDPHLCKWILLPQKVALNKEEDKEIIYLYLWRKNLIMLLFLVHFKSILP